MNGTHDRGDIMAQKKDKSDNKPIKPLTTPFSKSSKGVVIDGANILSTEPASVQRLVNTIEYAEQLGWKVLVGLKGSTYGFMKSKDSVLSGEDQKRLKQLIADNRIDIIRDDQDDLHLIRIALSGPYFLLSRDLYRDWIKQNPNEAEDITRCLRFVEFLGEEVSIDLPPSSTTTMVVGEPDSKNIVLQVKQKGSSAVLGMPLNMILGKKWLEEQGIANQYVSRQHFRLIEHQQGIFLEDLKSTNGTFIKGMRLPANHPHPLNEIDSFTIAGSLEFDIVQKG